MRKQAYYLPNLNQLRQQNRQYLRHRQKIQLSKSQYQLNAFSSNKHTKQIRSMQDQIKKLAELETIPSINTTSDINELNPVIEKRYRFEPSPFSRRKLQQQQRQNERLSKAMELSNPAIHRYNKKHYSNYSAVKEKMRYYTNDAGKVLYKFKKSLVDIQKRRRMTQQGGNNQSIKEKAKQRLQALLKESSQLSHISKVSATLPNDIFYNNGESIRLPSCSSSVEIKQKPNKKHTTNNIRSLPINQTRSTSQNYHNLTIYTNNNTIQAHQRQNNKISEGHYGGKKIVIHCSANPEVRTLIKQKRKKMLKDLEIVEITPTSNQL